MQNQDVRHNNPLLSSQSGNALWYILVAIALLAALTLSMTRNSGKMASNLDQEEASLMAERVARDLNSLGSTIERLQMLNKCSDEEISLDNQVLEDMSAGMAFNPRSPITGPRAYTCHVYDQRGGGLSYNKIPTGVLTPEAVTAGNDFGWYFTAANSVNGVGPEAPTETVCSSNCGDLIVGSSGVTDSVCRAFNNLVKINGIPVDTDDYTSQFFVGTYANAAANDARLNVGSGDATSALYGVKMACIYSSSSPVPHNLIYRVLVTR